MVQIEQLQLLIFSGPSGARASGRVTVYLIKPQWQLALYVLGMMLFSTKTTEAVSRSEVVFCQRGGTQKVPGRLRYQDHYRGQRWRSSCLSATCFASVSGI